MVIPGQQSPWCLEDTSSGIAGVVDITSSGSVIGRQVCSSSSLRRQCLVWLPCSRRASLGFGRLRDDSTAGDSLLGRAAQTNTYRRVLRVFCKLSRDKTLETAPAGSYWPFTQSAGWSALSKCSHCAHLNGRASVYLCLWSLRLGVCG